jgi:hypothetical protein
VCLYNPFKGSKSSTKSNCFIKTRRHWIKLASVNNSWCLEENNAFFPYKIQVLHKWKQGDYHFRFQYAYSQFGLVFIDPNALTYNGYSDECIFFLCGKVNKQNCRINDLRRRITDVVTLIPDATLHAMARNARQPRHLPGKAWCPCRDSMR